MNLRFSREKRIRNAKVIGGLVRKGLFFRGKNLLMWVGFDSQGKAEGIKGARLGIIVSRKVSKLATKRNLWKRRIREAFRQNQPQIKANVNIIVKARAGGHVPESKIIQEEFLQMMEKAKVLKKASGNQARSTEC